MSLDRRFRQFREKMSLLVVAQRSVVVVLMLLLASTSACSAGASAQKVVGGGDDGDAAVPSYPHNWRGGVAVRGFDVVAYHNLTDYARGVMGTPRFATNITRDGYTYEFWFTSQNNLDTFLSNQKHYVPLFGGFCAFGTAEERPPQWPWQRGTMGPPTGPAHGWLMLTTKDEGVRKLALNINRQFASIVKSNEDYYLRRATERWIEYYGSMDTGPINTRCYPNTWRSCTKELPNSTESGPYGWTYFNEMLGSEDGGAARNLMDMTFDNVVGADLELRAVQGYMREMKRNTP